MPTVVFVHPDLGIGGAERLVLDAALALQSKGHHIHIFTSHHDPKHCFEETRDGTLKVSAVGDWLPRHLFGCFFAFFAYLRMIYVAFYLLWFTDLRPDVIFCDQVSACIPVLRWTGAKILFYCHFPDQLLTHRKSALKKVYRAPLDWLEEKTTGMADSIVVNSKFTAQTFKKTFTSIVTKEPAVLYPSLHFKTFDESTVEDEAMDTLIPKAETVFLSINRYERKKNLSLAIKALAELRETVSEDVWNGTHLVMAGGYDERVAENKEHYLELHSLMKELDLDDHVTFLRSVSMSEKTFLLKKCTALIYTPSFEHLGLVPLEAMYMRRPVIAVNNGGPLETVDNNKTGFLCDATPIDFAVAMKRFLDDQSLSNVLGVNGRQHVIEKFSYETFSRELDALVKQIHGAEVEPATLVSLLIQALLMLFLFFTISYTVMKLLLSRARV